jgi:predicted RNA-binding protein with TRAM domain
MVGGPRRRAAALARLVPPPSSPAATAARAAPAEAADDVQPGRTFEVTVAGKDRDDPERNGIAYRQGVVILVPDSRPGDRVRVIIRERRRRFARSEVLERLGGRGE